MSDQASDSTSELELRWSEAFTSRDNPMGAPINPLGLKGWMVCGLLFGVATGILVFLSVEIYARRETIEGSIQPSAGAVKVSLTRPAVISDLTVHEGQLVKKGDVLMTLSLDPSLPGSGHLGETLSNISGAQTAALETDLVAKHRLFAAQRASLDAQVRGLADQVRALEEEASLAAERVRNAEQTVQAAEDLQRQGYMPLLQLRQRQDALLSARQALGQIHSKQSDVASSALVMRSQREQLFAQEASAEAQGQDAAAKLSERRATQQGEERIVLSATASGRVAALQARVGATVTPGTTLAVILPEGANLQAELWAPSRAVGFLRPGDRVRLRYDAFPFERFGAGTGTVASIAEVPTSVQDLPIPLRTEEQLYRVTVRLKSSLVNAYGNSWRLTPGMKLSADVVLEERPVLLWFFESLRAAKSGLAAR